MSRQYYKSGWMEKKGEGVFGKTKKRWFQLRHWSMYYFVDEQPGWNTTGYDPPEDDDPSLLDKIPGLPDLKLPSLKIPDLSLPDISMPDISMPDVSMPSMSMPDMKNVKMPKKKERYKTGPYGRIAMHGAKVKVSGKTITLSNADQVRIFKGENETKDGRSFTLSAPDEEEAKSWYESMAYGGAEKSD
eukprot:TRINITY_DN40254_c0_g1_i1.p1 TRINITY_DN40254_c0_g1~~TRINITY_DN40254_c0_g1_i1.p1  ORF type:complete len:198 (-),score=70.38 TRINITY_DN40254_c0_g1_i1:261-824(-)